MKKINKVIFLVILGVLVLPIFAFAKTENEIFDSILDENNTVTVYSVKPSIVNQMNDSMELLTPYFQKLVGDEYDVFSMCNSEDGLSDCDLQIGQVNRNIQINWVEPTEKVDEIVGYLNGVTKAIEDENGDDDLTQYYTLTDLALINYLIQSDKSELWNPGAASRALRFVKELNDIVDGANVEFNMMIGRGDQDPALMYEYAGGAVSIYYNGSVYGEAPAGVYTKRVIYIPESTADTPEAYAKAAQDRIANYLGNNSVTVEVGGRLDTLLDIIPANSYFSKDDVIDMGTPNERPIAYTDLLDPTIPEATTDGNFYNVKIGNMTYKFYVIKADSSKLVEPTYKGRNIDTNIQITSDDSAVPLDTAITVKKVNDNTIKAKIGTDNYVSYDISLFSNAKGDNVRRLDNGKFIVRIPVPANLVGKTVTVYYIPTEGEVEEHEAKVEEKNGSYYAVFETNHFSTYTLAEKASTISSTEEVPKTLDKVTTYASLLIISILGIGTTISLAKKNY